MDSWSVRVKALRKWFGWTQQDAAEALGCSVGAVRLVEGGHTLSPRLKLQGAIERKEAEMCANYHKLS